MLHYCFNYPHYTLYIYTYLYIYIHTYIYIYIPIYTYNIYIYTIFDHDTYGWASPKSILSSLGLPEVIHIIIYMYYYYYYYYYISLYMIIYIVLYYIIFYFILLCDNIFMLYIYISIILGVPWLSPEVWVATLVLGPVHHFHYHRDL